jgi:hypothetical protein
METRTQYRAACSICFRKHAVRGNVMVQHGYHRPEGWHANVGQCTGTNQQHFGTERGREIAAQNAVFIREWAETRRADARKLRKHPPAKVSVSGKWLGAGKGYEQISVGADDHRYAGKLQSMIRGLEQDAQHAGQSAAEIERRVTAWQPVEPRAEKVASGPTMHYQWNRSRAGVFCAFQNWTRSGGVRYFAKTTDWAAVTCTRCLKARAKIESGEYKDVAKVMS